MQSLLGLQFMVSLAFSVSMLDDITNEMHVARTDLVKWVWGIPRRINMDGMLSRIMPAFHDKISA